MPNFDGPSKMNPEIVHCVICKYTMFFFCILLSVLVLNSCTSVRQIQYFQDLPDSSVVHLLPIEKSDRFIEKGDRLLITFGSKDAGAAAMFNQYGGVSPAGVESQGAAASEITGFIVDDSGFLEFPYIGQVKAQKLTLAQLKDTLVKKAGVFLKDPYVLARYYDFKVTVLGEVKSPGIYSLPQSKASLFHAFGAAGDLTRSGNRSNIEIFRDVNGQRTVTKIDMKSKYVLDHPEIFLLQNNDVVYVQPSKVGLKSENPAIFAGILSVVVSLATLIVTINK